jgi:hypothetical protein
MRKPDNDSMGLRQDGFKLYEYHAADEAHGAQQGTVRQNHAGTMRKALFALLAILLVIGLYPSAKGLATGNNGANDAYADDSVTPTLTYTVTNSDSISYGDTIQLDYDLRYNDQSVKDDDLGAVTYSYSTDETSYSPLLSTTVLPAGTYYLKAHIDAYASSSSGTSYNAADSVEDSTIDVTADATILEVSLSNCTANYDDDGYITSYSWVQGADAQVGISSKLYRASDYMSADPTPIPNVDDHIHYVISSDEETWTLWDPTANGYTDLTVGSYYLRGIFDGYNGIFGFDYSSGEPYVSPEFGPMGLSVAGDGQFEYESTVSDDILINVTAAPAAPPSIDAPDVTLQAGGPAVTAKVSVANMDNAVAGETTLSVRLLDATYAQDLTATADLSAVPGYSADTPIPFDVSGIATLGLPDMHTGYVNVTISADDAVPAGTDIGYTISATPQGYSAITSNTAALYITAPPVPATPATPGTPVTPNTPATGGNGTGSTAGGSGAQASTSSASHASSTPQTGDMLSLCALAFALLAFDLGGILMLVSRRKRRAAAKRASEWQVKL